MPLDAWAGFAAAIPGPATRFAVSQAPVCGRACGLFKRAAGTLLVGAGLATAAARAGN